MKERLRLHLFIYNLCRLRGLAFSKQGDGVGRLEEVDGCHIPCKRVDGGTGKERGRVRNFAVNLRNVFTSQESPSVLSHSV